LRIAELKENHSPLVSGLSIRNPQSEIRIQTWMTKADGSVMIMASEFHRAGI
jgi:hypothetical protein